MSGASGLALFARFAFSMAVVLGLIALCTRVYRRGRMGSRRRGTPIEVLARQSLTKRSQVVVLRAGDRGLVLGVTDSSVQVLAETDLGALGAAPIEIEPAASPPGPAASGTTSPGRALALPPTWKGMIEDLRERTVRRS
jgi:flagellar protein FliO/FliZ